MLPFFLSLLLCLQKKIVDQSEGEDSGASAKDQSQHKALPAYFDLHFDMSTMEVKLKLDLIALVEKRAVAQDNDDRTKVDERKSQRCLFFSATGNWQSHYRWSSDRRTAKLLRR